MKTLVRQLKLNFLAPAIAIFALTSCEKEEATPNLRANISYTQVTDSTPYKSLFISANGDSTVDLKSGNDRLKMFQAINYYLGEAIRNNKTLDGTVMINMFSNTGNPFSDIASLNLTGAALNTSGVQLRNITAASTADAETARLRLETLFGQMANVSKSVGVTAKKGTAGQLGNYLVDAQGVETAQVIQKSLIGAFQLDYISNVLLDKGLDADNYSLVSGKPYTQLEHNWDEAYGLLTLNPIYLAGSTDAARGTSESFLGSYIWEYNKASYSKIYTAFLKGRVAIVNNDKTELKTQATFIRTEMEKALAAAAVGYLGKWKTGTTDASRAHAIGEGLGFIYSLRYCAQNGANTKFSDDILNALITPTTGFWDLTNDKVNAAADAITSKFKL
ncbi:DUF4856 domain-containing protein [Lacihabitans lacunae]|uniref:DUF4856 domain-containing protein n=1 Tax=Lacihabitans lacunae TaxID=1028214 RepID=A0ABV7YT18_9BACT